MQAPTPGSRSQDGFQTAIILALVAEGSAANTSGLQPTAQTASVDLPPALPYGLLLFFLLKRHFCHGTFNFVEINHDELAKLLPCATLPCQLQPY